VIEIDAASHGGVDDARDLRERAFFAPVASPYKVYVIDEAHMVTPQGFNALLKLVEEPPSAPALRLRHHRARQGHRHDPLPHHHYPFRLVPPRVLADYLTSVAQPRSTRRLGGAAMIVRAGAGSVRDSLSVSTSSSPAPARTE
jgi:DNA polymerase-3 subunit gamma/tau